MVCLHRNCKPRGLKFDTGVYYVHNCIFENTKWEWLFLNSQFHFTIPPKKKIVVETNKETIKQDDKSLSFRQIQLNLIIMRQNNYIAS